MPDKTKRLLIAKRNVEETARFNQYIRARGRADASVLNMDINDVQGMISMLRQFSRVSEQLRQIPGVDAEQILNAHKQQLPEPVRSMVDIWGLDSLIMRCEHAVKIDKFRPRNLSLIDMAARPDLYNIVGDFSTFDRNLSKKNLQNMTVNHVKEYMNNNIPTSQTCATEVANAVLAVLNKNSLEQKNLILDSNLLTYSLFFQKIADDMMKELNLPGDAPWISFVESWDFLPDAPKELMAMSGGGDNPYIIMNLNRLREKYSGGPDTLFQDVFTFFGVCASFAHEFTHFIDRQYPNRGALGAQKENLSRVIYDKNSSEYKKNPNEKTPLLTGNIVEQELFKNAFNHM